MRRVGLTFKFKGFKMTVGGYADEAGSWSLLHVEFHESPQRLSQLLSLKPERGCLLTDIEYEAREAWAKNTK